MSLGSNPKKPTEAPTSNVGAVVHFFSRTNRALAIAAGAAMVGIALLIVINVLLRYFTGKAILGAEEIVQLTMVPVIFLAIAYCGQIGGHISVDIFESVLPRGFWRIVDPIVKIVGAITFAAMCWQAIQSGMMAGEFSETTNIRRIPLQPIWYMLAFGALFAAIIEFSKLWPISQNHLGTEEEAHDE
jgi:TRAP-type C4-dicarboxylate transport system permease small subunit